jgi:hypothetical protein
LALFSYDHQGDDWAEKYFFCRQPQQSPIPLYTPVGKYGQMYKIFASELDSF